MDEYPSIDYGKLACIALFAIIISYLLSQVKERPCPPSSPPVESRQDADDNTRTPEKPRRKFPFRH